MSITGAVIEFALLAGSLAVVSIALWLIMRSIESILRERRRRLL